MNDDLIKRSDAIKAVNKVDDYGDGIGFEVRSHCLVELELVPSADRPQGEWIDKGWKGDWQFETDGRGNCWHEYECSECGFHNKGSKSNYCPNCGARMKGAGDE